MNYGPPITSLIAEPLTEANYAPYGKIIGPLNSQNPITGAQFSAKWWRVMTLDISDGTPEIVYASMPHRPIQIRQFERHLLVTQAFIPLQNQAFLQIVAEPTDNINPYSIRAFILDGSMGVAMHRGTWHVEFFPIGAVGNFVVITRAETSDALISRDASVLAGDTEYWDVPPDWSIDILFPSSAVHEGK